MDADHHLTRFRPPDAHPWPYRRPAPAFSGSSATRGDDPSFDLLACRSRPQFGDHAAIRRAGLKKPGDSYEHRNELFPDEDFEITYER